MKIFGVSFVITLLLFWVFHWYVDEIYDFHIWQWVIVALLGIVLIVVLCSKAHYFWKNRGQLFIYALIGFVGLWIVWLCYSIENLEIITSIKSCVFCHRGSCIIKYVLIVDYNYVKFFTPIGLLLIVFLVLFIVQLPGDEPRKSEWWK